MNDEIGDVAAREFAIAFYDALGANRSYDDAYEFGCGGKSARGDGGGVGLYGGTTVLDAEGL
jgi:hypothetical protein